MEKEQAARIREKFESFDADNNGRIDLQEFIELLKVLSPEMDGRDVEAGFSFVDQNDDGSIDFEEFLDWWQEAGL